MAEFVTVGKLDEVEEGRGKLCVVGETTIALFRVRDTIYAINNECPHQGGPLADGDLDGTGVYCPWHQWKFDFTTGVCLSIPTLSVACYPVEIVGDEIRVGL